MVTRDLSLILPAARKHGIPVIIGSAGGAGGEPHLNWTVDIARRVATAFNLRFRLAVISAELDKNIVVRRFVTVGSSTQNRFRRSPSRMSMPTSELWPKWA